MKPQVSAIQIWNEHPAYEQRRVDLAIFRAMPASTWGHCPQVLCFTTVWHTPERKKLPNGLPPPPAIFEGFNEIYAVYGPKKPYKTREKRQSCQIDPCLPPYMSTLHPNSRIAKVWFGRSTNPSVGHTPQYGRDFPEEIPGKSGKTTETLSELFLELPSRSTAGIP